MRTTLGAWLLLAAAIALGGCQPTGDTPPAVRIGHAPHDHHAPLYVAASRPGQLAAPGGVHLREIAHRRHYEVVGDGDGDGEVRGHLHIDVSTGGAELVRRLSEGQLDLAFGGVPAMLGAIDAGAPIRIVAPIMAEGAGLVVGEWVPAASWAELVAYLQGTEKPLRIGYKTGFSVQNLILERALTVSGLDFTRGLGGPPAEVRLVNLHGAGNLLPALEAGIIDGFVVMQPHLALAEARGARRVAFLHELPPQGQWRAYPCCALAARTDFLEDHPELATDLVALMIRARDALADDPARSARTVARWLGLPEEVEACSLPTIRFDVALDKSWSRGIEVWVDAMATMDRLGGAVAAARREGTLPERIYDLRTYREAVGATR